MWLILLMDAQMPFFIHELPLRLRSYKIDPNVHFNLYVFVFGREREREIGERFLHALNHKKLEK